jgi:hypothetical protein
LAGTTRVSEASAGEQVAIATAAERIALKKERMVDTVL